MLEWIGKTIGKVRIERQIAKGGMAEVYLGTHLTLDRPVAVKVMHQFIEADPDLQSRFEREAKVVAGLRHSNIVQIFDYDTEDGHPYIVMEYLKGPTLAAYLRELHKRSQRLQPTQVARLLNTIATALDYAHQRGVIHRDIKPGNIILHSKTDEVALDQPITEQTEPVLTDFGLVRIVQSVTQTASGAVSGTPAYMSPEQAQGIKVDHRSDIYSLGVVLYELVAGRIPFEADTSWTVIFKHINEPPPPIGGIQPAVQQVIDRALAKKPEDRYQSARALAADYMDAIGLISEASTLRMSMPAASGRRPAPDLAPAESIPQAKASGGTAAWTRFAAAAGGAVLLIALVFSLFSRFSGAGQPAQTPATPTMPPHNPTSAPAAGVPTVDSNAAAPVEAERPAGLLRFQDGTAPADALTVSTEAMPRPPAGKLYEVWLIEDDGEQRISLGSIQFDEADKGSLSYVDDEGQNLIGTYSAMEITAEPDPDPNPNSSNEVVFSARLPEEGLMHVRHLLFAFDATPGQIGFVRGLDEDTKLLADLSTRMLTAFESGDEADLLLQAENMLNLIVGSQSEDHRDWDGNGAVDDPGDGYGLLFNGDNLGYIQGSYTHADLALTSPDATSNMLTHGEHVKICATNAGNWTAQLRSQLIDIIENPASPERDGLIRQAVARARQIREGVDVDGNERVEPIPDEGGALTAYEHAYYMADMIILPAGSQATAP